MPPKPIFPARTLQNADSNSTTFDEQRTPPFDSRSRTKDGTGSSESSQNTDASSNGKIVDSPPPSGPSRPNPTYFRRLLAATSLTFRQAWTGLKILFVIGIPTVILYTMTGWEREFKKYYTVKDGTWVRIALNELHIVEAPNPHGTESILTLLSPGLPRTTLAELISCIISAAEDPRVKGLELVFNESRGPQENVPLSGTVGLAGIQELRAAIQGFKTIKRAQLAAGKDVDGSAKPPVTVKAFADDYGKNEYLLAAVADEIFLHSAGRLELTGLAIASPFYGPFLKKWGIVPIVEARREYKSAVAPYIGTTWNTRSRENLSDLLWSFQAQYLDAFILARNDRLTQPFDMENALQSFTKTMTSIRSEQLSARIELEDAMKLVDGPWSAVAAQELGLVDGIAFVRTHENAVDYPIVPIRFYQNCRLIEQTGRKARHGVIGSLLGLFRSRSKRNQFDEETTEVDDADTPKYVSSGEFQIEGNRWRLPVVSKQKIGLIYIDGGISRGGHAGAESIATHILRAAKHPLIDAIVIRVSSPGGEANASDTIWEAVELAKKSKPVIGSMGNTAASGGYYVLSGCNRILALPGTITGSIGVFIAFPNAQGLLRRLDLSVDSIETSPSSKLDSGMQLFDSLPENERLKITQLTDEMYDIFKDRVSKGRGLGPESVEEIAQGQVFTGAQAVGVGLVDQIGGLMDAVAEADGLARTRQGLAFDDKLIHSLLTAKGEMQLSAFKAAVSLKRKEREESGMSVEEAAKPAPDDPQMEIVCAPTTQIVMFPGPREGSTIADLLAGLMGGDEQAALSRWMGYSDEHVDMRKVKLAAWTRLLSEYGFSILQLPASFWLARNQELRDANEGMISQTFKGILKLFGANSSRLVAEIADSRKIRNMWEVRMEMPPLDLNTR